VYSCICLARLYDIQLLLYVTHYVGAKSSHLGGDGYAGLLGAHAVLSTARKQRHRFKVLGGLGSAVTPALNILVLHAKVVQPVRAVLAVM
jgi:hypothetical protein